MASSSSTPRGGPSVSVGGMTTLMQDRQARNKPLIEENEVEDSDITRSRTMTFEVQERRRKAATILDSPELLMAYSHALQDSMAGTRQLFTKILCGYEDQSTEQIWGGLKTYNASKTTNSDPPSLGRRGAISQ